MESFIKYDFARPLPPPAYFHPNGVADYFALSFVALTSLLFLIRPYTWDKPDPYRHRLFERPQEGDAGRRAGEAASRDIAQKVEESVSTPDKTHKGFRKEKNLRLIRV